MPDTSPFSSIVGHARRAPEAPAVVDLGGVTLTYAALAHRARLRAGSLHDLGLKNRHRLISTLSDGPSVALAWAAAACAGCSYVPLNPRLSKPEFERYLRLLEPSAILTDSVADSAAVAAARAAGLPVLETRGDRFELGAGSTPVHASPSGIEDEAVVFLTSGTTSRPKVVPHTYTGITTAALWIARGFDLRTDDRSLVLSPLYHAAGLNGGVWAPLVTGASFVSAKDFQAADVFRWLDKLEPTSLTAAPAVYQNLVDYAVRNPDALGKRCLRFVRTVGAPLSNTLRDQVERLLGVPFVQTYGMSEAPPIAMEPRRPAERKRGAIGPAVEGVDISIRDQHLRDQPPEVDGEIWVRGANVTPGYWKDEAATCAAFRDGWFRTGDLGHLDADGYLYLSGRVTDTINRGGEKVAPSEVEEVLAAHPAVREVIVFALPDPVLGEEVAAAVVLRRPARAVDLQRFAAGELASHKVPRRIVFLDELPRNSTAKALRVQIAASTQLRLRSESKHETRVPRTSTERLLVRLCEETLGIEGASATSHFFDIGGSSLDAVKFLARISAARGLPPIQPAVMLWAPRLSELAELVDNPSELTLRGDFIPLQRRGDRPALVFLGAGPELRHVLSLLGEDQPVYSIRLPDLANSPELDTFEKIAAFCVRVLERARLDGPAILSGWCLGGMLALEVGRQALVAGLDVPAVVLIDARGLAGNRTPVPVKVLRKIQFHASRFLSLRGAARWRYLAARLSNAAQKGLARSRSLDHSGRLVQAWRQFTPRFFDGCAIHFWAKFRPKGDTLDGWEDLAASVERIEILGDHVTLFDKANAAAFAAALRKSTEVCGREVLR